MARNTAKKILRDAGLDFKHSLYRKMGDWYHLLERFPGALLDKKGYILFQTEAEFRSFVTKSVKGQVYENRDKNTLIAKGGISNHPGYISFTERFVFPEQIAQTNVIEGATIRVTVNRYERDARALS